MLVKNIRWPLKLSSTPFSVESLEGYNYIVGFNVFHPMPSKTQENCELVFLLRFGLDHRTLWGLLIL